jgi:hypothetical protein
MSVVLTLYFLWIIGQTLLLLAARYWRPALYHQYRAQSTEALISIALVGALLGLLCAGVLDVLVANQWHIWISSALAGACILLDHRLRRSDLMSN